MLAVRKVTQENRGKKTAGIDGIKSLSHSERLKLAKKLKLSHRAKPARRVWIPKPGKDEKRPLGIPVIEDRAKQALIKLALEPEWEAFFEPNSYGFRLGRTCHDAIAAIYLVVRAAKDKWILDADIKGCFDNINHEYLLKKLNTFPKFRRQIKAWLKAGVIDWSQISQIKGYPATKNGTPQGGIISPLLANVALHGLEIQLKEWVAKIYKPLEYDKHYGGYRPLRPHHIRSTLSIIRYADDFVVIHKEKWVVEQAKEKVREFLSNIGLELKESKTKLVNIREGFNFLGFHVRMYETGGYRSDRNSQGKPTGERILIKPIKESVSRHYLYLEVAELIGKMNSATPAQLIAKLNPKIAGWANYYKYAVSTETFSKLNNLIWKRLWRWAARRHPNQGHKWIAKKYFPDVDNRSGDRWRFKLQDQGKTLSLVRYTDTKINQFIKVKGEASIFDGNDGYWGKRLSNHPFLNKRETALLKRQKGKCSICQIHFKDGDRWEIDHINPKAKGGLDVMNNLQLVHRHCHVKKSIINHDYRGQDSPLEARSAVKGNFHAAF